MARGPARGGRAAPPRRRRSLLRHATRVVFTLGLWGGVGLAGFIGYHATQLPPIDTLAVPKRPPNIAILTVDGQLLANRGETGGRVVTLAELPPYLPNAFIAIEDRRFRDHWGVDPIGIARAVTRNLTSRGVAQGGSTLTQQLAKNVFLTQERTAARKVQEAILAVWLERNYSKDQILELYMNRVYFGSGAYGVEAAAQRYFGKPARAVTLAEAAMLAGLVQAPSRLAPTRNLAAAQARSELVLAAMAREGLASEGMLKTALAQPAATARPAGAGSNGYVADLVMDALADLMGVIDKDVVVTTTIDGRMQAAAERAIVDELSARGQRFGVREGALVALAPDGALRALVGGRSYAESQFNRAAAARRQPGSAFKPFVYLAALERGLTPDTVRRDSPVTIRGWTPDNFSRDFRGDVTLTEALALSLNTVAVKLNMEAGPAATAEVAARLGVASKLNANPSLALGTSEVTPLELTAAFAAFGNGGLKADPFVVTRVRTVDGKTVYQRRAEPQTRVIDGRHVPMMTHMMRETLLSGTARKAELRGWDAGGKTGTSQDHRDAWFLGFTAALTAGVWFGNDDNEPTRRTTGGNLPAEAWARFMTAALAGVPPQGLPGGAWRSAAPPPDPVASLLNGGAREGGRAPSGAVGGFDPARSDGGSPPAAPSRAPIVLGQGGGAAPSREAGLRPPGNVPGGSVGAAGGAAPRERNLLERLFGG